MLRRSQAHEKMPCGRGRTIGNTDNLLNRGGCPLSKRYPNPKNCNLPPKECQGPPPSLENSEQRFIILNFGPTLIFVLPISLPAQGHDLNNHLESGAHVNGDGLELSPPRYKVDLPKEQNINSSECTGSTKSCSSSGTNVCGHFRNSSSKSSKSVNNASSTFLPAPIISNNISGFGCDASDFLFSNIPKVDKPVKRASRKKGKKKGKHYKKPTNKKGFPALESICDASVSETHVSSDTACIVDYNSQKNTLPKIPSPSLAVKDENMMNDNDRTNSSPTQSTRSSYITENDDPETLVSFSQSSFTGELRCIQSGMNEGCNHLASKSSSTISPEIPRSSSDESSANAVRIQNDTRYDTTSIILSDQDNPPVEGTFQDDWKTDTSENSSDYVEAQSSIMDDGGIALDAKNSDTSFFSISDDSCDRNSVLSTNFHRANNSWSKYVLGIDNGTERAQCSSDTSSSNDFQPVTYRKKGRLTKKLAQSTNGTHRFGTTNVHGWTARDNNHSIWQRVQKKDTKECIREPNKFNLVSQRIGISSDGLEMKTRFGSNVGFEHKGRRNLRGYACLEVTDQTAQIDFSKASSKDVDLSELLHKSLNGRCNAHDKLRRKPSLASKQGNHYAMKETHTSKTSIDKPKIHAQRKGVGISLQSTYHECIGSGLSPDDSNGCTSDVPVPTAKIDFPSGQHRGTPSNVEKDAAVENVHSVICYPPSQDTGELISPFAMATTSLDDEHIKLQSQDTGELISPFAMATTSLDDEHINMHKDFCPLRNSEGSKNMRSENESSHADNSKMVSDSTFVMQKWVPVAKKDSVVSSKSQTGSLRAVVNGSVPANLNSKNEEVELWSSNSPHSHQINAVPCSSPCSKDIGCPYTEADEGTECHPPTTYGEVCGGLPVSNCFLSYEAESLQHSGSESDLVKILQAVRDSCRLQIASQGVHLVTGSPVAEFERFLHSASPVLDDICCTRNCKLCSTNQLIGDSFCRHRIPDISLKSFWQWYEKPGSYGIEVKVEDCYDPRRFHNSEVAFHAYFIPYLSAVQLFGWSRNSFCANNADPHKVVSETREVCKTSKSSYPILSVPLSQPREQEDAYLLKLSSPTEDEVCNKSVRSTYLDGGTLLFEYFESNQPQQRRPLYEMIKEITRGYMPSSCQTYGDPLKLECLNLHDLHPASWYSVAWYPIYRIPDGNFRASFLTYHSLGHFDCSVSNTPSGVCSVTSPAVGLQSYNTKGECWFRARDSTCKVAQTEGSLPLDHSEILKERLRTLERTASVMARASVRKGNLKCMNRQPDHEFFVSRRR